MIYLVINLDIIEMSGEIDNILCFRLTPNILRAWIKACK